MVEVRRVPGFRRRSRPDSRRLLERRKVRRGLDATIGAVLLGFSARLATEHV